MGTDDEASRTETTLVVHAVQKEQRENSNALTNSTWIKLAQESLATGRPLRFAFLDVDSTLTGDHENMIAILKKLKKEGYITFLVTARGEEMLVNDEEYEKSDFGRPKAKLKEHHLNEPKELRSPEYVAGIAGSTGSNIILHQQTGGYQAYAEYRDTMGHQSDRWRAHMITMATRLGRDNYLSLLEHRKRYDDGLNDIAPPDFRIALDFNKDSSADENLKQQKECADAVRNFKKKCAVAWAIKKGKLPNKVSDTVQKLVDNQEVQELATGDEEFLQAVLNLRVGHDSNPGKDQFNIILTPKNGTKEFAIEFMIDQICTELGMERSALDHVFISGDGYADLKAGVRGINMIVDTEGEDEESAKAIATYVVPKHSRLTSVLHRLQEATQNVEDELLPAGLRVSAYPIRPADRTGWYSYEPKRNIPDLQQASEKLTIKSNYRPTEVVVGDEAYGGAQSAPESILMYLNEKYPDI